MENAQTENSAAGGASELTDVLERMRARADNAYCDYIGQLRRDECLGWEIKVERGKFGEAEMKAHCAAAEKLGRHRALHEAANMLAEVLRSNIQAKRDRKNAACSRCESKASKPRSEQSSEDAEATQLMNWTKPYYGITHFGELRDEFRCTVCDYGTFANLSLYRKGCPRISETVYATVEDAKLIGERWVKSGGTK